MHQGTELLLGILLGGRVNSSWPSEKEVKLLELGLEPWCLLGDLKALVDTLSVLSSLW